METDNTRHEIAEELRQIRLQITQIKWMFAGALAFAVLTLTGPGPIIAFVWKAALIALILAAVVYAALFLFEKFINWKAGPGHAEERMRAIIEEYESKEPEAEDANHDPNDPDS